MPPDISPILDSLRDIGLGPQRLERARQDCVLFGPGGLLNSIELVQFIASLSEQSGIDAFEFMEGFQPGTEGILSSVGRLQAFLAERAPQARAS
ncbi:hypothetical protein KM176_20355 [Pseudooceanicola sp. CBS1P-1]|uniref:Carrier domain-containing protein n=1 Tax=Pseudooceanicola albus TaxID=2692189 RepID=A0A6L7G7S4_9RHOB|nr:MULTISPECIES: hypothetical protein [Pseudooceanicola]MBT9386234.1 hypothetical protein [Pseudooceanicola endophyticus]MXN20284.1 hypothetical protein [Pseudooceanicola albus]